MNGKHKWFMSV